MEAVPELTEDLVRDLQQDVGEVPLHFSAEDGLGEGEDGESDGQIASKGALMRCGQIRP